MNCKRIRPLLSAYHDGELDPAQEADVTAHLAACPECTRVLEEYVRKYPDHWFWPHRRWKSTTQDY